MLTGILIAATVDAVIWDMPIISLDAMRQAYFRDRPPSLDPSRSAIASGQ
jgi:hypothetical protein